MILYSKFTPNENNNFYFKKYLLISIITYFLTIFFLSYLLSIDVNQFWFFLGVPAKEKIFSDIYPFFVTSDCKLISNTLTDYYDQFRSCDPWNRIFNYMPIWLNFLKMGINLKYLYFFGILFVLLFYFSLFKLINIKTKKNFYIYLFLILSPVTMLAVERGNSDLLIFSLVLFFLYLCRFDNIYKVFFGYLILFTAALIKFYPIFAVFVFFKKNFYNKIFSLITFILFIFYFIFNFDQINLIKQNTLESPFFSYGYNVFEANLFNFYNKIEAYRDFFLNFDISLISLRETIDPFIFPLELKNNNFIISKIFFISSILLLVIIFFKKKRNIINYKLINYNNSYPEMIAGAFIFSGSFILGANWDYRLIFLLLVIPYLTSISSTEKKYSRFIILVILFVFWLSPISIFLFGIDEVFLWLIFVFLSFLVINHTFFCFFPKLVK